MRNMLGNAFGFIALSLIATAAVAQVQPPPRPAPLPTPSYSEQTYIFGVDRYNRLVMLPPVMCVRSGQRIHVLADVVNGYGYRRFIPKEAFTWRLDRAYGYADHWRWDGIFGSGLFQRGAWPLGTVFVTVPYLDHGDGYLSVNSIYGRTGAVFLIDPVLSHPNRRCVWAHPDVYR